MGVSMSKPINRERLFAWHVQWRQARRISRSGWVVYCVVKAFSLPLPFLLVRLLTSVLLENHRYVFLLAQYSPWVQRFPVGMLNGLNHMHRKLFHCILNSHNQKGSIYSTRRVYKKVSSRVIKYESSLCFSGDAVSSTQLQCLRSP